MMKTIYHVFLLSVILWNCADQTAGPGTTDTENVIVFGKVTNKEGNAVSDAKVRLRSNDYLRSQLGLSKLSYIRLNSTTGKDGSFKFDSVEAGSYLIEVLDTKENATVFSFEADSSVSELDLGTRRLETKILVTGVVAAAPNDSGMIVQVYGMERSEKVDNISGEYELMLPKGEYDLHFSSEAMEIDGVTMPDVMVDDPIFEELEVVVLKDSADDFFHWHYLNKITLNTSKTGAEITEDVLDFPLLVRIDQMISPEFDFSRTLEDGGDVRFTKADGTTEIPYEIEVWDRKNQMAVIWVRMDTVFANSTSQTIYLYTGNDKAQTQSSGPEVFNEADGYIGVWHLNENVQGTGNTGVYKNAVADRDHGTDFISSSNNSYLFSPGQYFSREDYIVVESPASVFKPDSQVMMSLWFKTNSVDSVGSEFINMGNDYGMRIMLEGNIRIFVWEDYGPVIPDSLDYILHSSRTDLLDYAWHHVVGVFNRSELKLYVDGVLDTSQVLPVESLIYDGGPNFYFGTHGSGEVSWDYQGAMDEVRVSSELRSDMWIKLSYETQREGSKTLTIE